MKSKALYLIYIFPILFLLSLAACDDMDDYSSDPKHTLWFSQDTLRRVIKLRKSGVPLPRVPEVNAELCTHCGVCAVHCPSGAILKGDECNTIAEKCIKCCACVKGCSFKARTYDTPFASLLSDCFVRQKEDRIIL